MRLITGTIFNELLAGFNDLSSVIMSCAFFGGMQDAAKKETGFNDLSSVIMSCAPLAKPAPAHDAETVSMTSRRSSCRAPQDSENLLSGLPRLRFNDLSSVIMSCALETPEQHQRCSLCFNDLSSVIMSCAELCSPPDVHTEYLFQ